MFFFIWLRHLCRRRNWFLLLMFFIFLFWSSSLESLLLFGNWMGLHYTWLVRSCYSSYSWCMLDCLYRWTSECRLSDKPSWNWTIYKSLGTYCSYYGYWVPSNSSWIYLSNSRWSNWRLSKNCRLWKNSWCWMRNMRSTWSSTWMWIRYHRWTNCINCIWSYICDCCLFWKMWW